MFAFKKQKAFTLIELILTLSIGLLIIIIAYQGYKVMENDAKVKQTADAIRMIFDDANNLTVTRLDYRMTNVGGSPRNMTINDIVNNRGVGEMPMGIIAGSGSVLNRFGGTFTLSSQSSTGSAHDLLRVEVSNVPSGLCLHLLNRLAPYTYDMYVNGNLVAVGPPSTSVARGRNEVRTDKVAPLCNASTHVTLAFRKLKELNYTSMRRGPYADLTPAEQAILIPEYNRVENAMAAREAAQLSIP